MSRSADVLVGPPATPEGIALEVGSLLKIEFLRSDKYDQAMYEASTPSQFILIGGHDLVNDKDMLFEEYPVQISIWTTPRDKALLLGAQIYEFLLLSRRYPLMLVDDVQMLLRKFSPDGDHLSTSAAIHLNRPGI